MEKSKEPQDIGSPPHFFTQNVSPTKTQDSALCGIIRILWVKSGLGLCLETQSLCVRNF